MRAILGVLALAAGFAFAGGAAACGSADEPCTTPLGAYHIVRPAGEDPVPAFVYFHGAGGSGRTVHEADFAAALVARGYAVIAPDGLERPGSRFGPGWFFRPGVPALRDELAFTREVLDDAAARHGVDRSRVLVSGYSIGGSLVWYLACREHDLAAAYASYAGDFWEPLPPTCDGPVRLLHTHGWIDQTFPLEGRMIREDAIQGDAFAGMAVWRTVNGCRRLPDAVETTGRYWKRRWTSCTAGALEFALWPGGHVPPDAEWAEMAADWFEGLEAPGQ